MVPQGPEATPAWGLTGTYLRDFSYSCTQMLLYSALRRLGSSWALAGGAIAASVAALVSHPFDALRTRAGLAGWWARGVPGIERRGSPNWIVGSKLFCRLNRHHTRPPPKIQSPNLSVTVGPA